MSEKIQIFRSHQIYTANKDKELVDGYIMTSGNKILDVFSGEVRPDHWSLAHKFHDFRGKTITPGLVDSHTHLVHAGSREHELALKLAGSSYMELHMEGGIKSTVKQTRLATADELAEKAHKTLLSMLLHGTTSLEAKSGYGLDKDTELRVLRVNKELDKTQAISIVSTYMGAHDLPLEFSSNEEYINFMIEEVMPVIRKEDLATFCDIFCEEGIFSLGESRKIAEAAKELGFKIKVHADEIAPLGGAGLAVDLGAVSAEHLMAISDADIEKMAASDTVAVLLPATTLFLRAEDFAPARKMREKGVQIAFASDYNPGSSPCENLQMAMDMACLGMGMMPLEILEAVTINAAKAICKEKEIGSLEKGKYADLTIFEAKNVDCIFYHFGVNRVSDVFKQGRHVVHDGQLDFLEIQACIMNKQHFHNRK